MAALKQVVPIYQALTQEWNKKPANLDKCGELLSNLKVALTKLQFLPTTEGSASKQELLIGRDVLEIGAQWAIAKKDITLFERYMAQLSTYYFDYKGELAESAYKYQLLGLNLLRLLAQNKLADFHTALEMLPAHEITQNVYIKHPVCIEQYLMEGSYNKVFLARGNVPAESYNFFIDILLQTIRDEIGTCMATAYDKVAARECARMLFLDNGGELAAFAEKRGWQLSRADNFYHFRVEEKKTETGIPARQLAMRSIDYARELEQIV